MSWWSSVVDGIKNVSNEAGHGLKWVWNNGSLIRLTTGILKYTTNTAFQVLEQGLALRHAIPSILYKTESRKILNGMAYVAVYDVLPLVGLNYVNNSIQSYCREGIDENPAWLTASSVFLSALTLVNYGVKAYTWRQGAQTFIRITALDSIGPSAFNANTTHPPLALCVDKKCNARRKIKGMLREPLILLTNDGFIWAISFIPYVGEIASRVVKIYFNGRYVTRLATPELCERHKFQLMMQESILSLGLTYELTTMLMDYILESTTGMPPYLYYRTMRHLLLLLHVNLAAHMTLPLVESKDASLPVDPLNVYESVCRFIADVVFSGLIKRVPIDFKMEKGAKPLIPLGPTLQLATRLLNSDLEIEKPVAPGVFSKTTEKMMIWFFPPILQSADGLINDPILAPYWPALRQGFISSVDVITAVGKSNGAATLSWAPKSVATTLNLLFGVPKKLTKLVLTLRQEDDFWRLADALKAWFERHNITREVVLVKNSALSLHGDRLIEVPKQNDTAPSLIAADLVATRLQTRAQNEPVIKAEDLVPIKKREVVIVSDNPASLFVTRRRTVPPKVPVDEQNVLINIQQY